LVVDPGDPVSDHHFASKLSSAQLSGGTHSKCPHFHCFWRCTVSFFNSWRSLRVKHVLQHHPEPLLGKSNAEGRAPAALADIMILVFFIFMQAYESMHATRKGFREIGRNHVQIYY
jgi:hypothetical protein